MSAAFATPMEAVQTPNAPRAVVNTAAPQVPADLAGLVTGVAGLDGLFRQRSMLEPRPATAPSSGRRRRTTDEPGARRGEPGDAAGVRRCGHLRRPAPRHLHVDAAVVDLRPRPAVRPGPLGGRADDRRRRVRAVRGQRLRRLRVLLRPLHADQQRRWSTAGRPGRPAGPGRPRSTSSSPRTTRPRRRSSSTRRPTTTTPRPSTCSTRSRAATPPTS